MAISDNDEDYVRLKLLFLQDDLRQEYSSLSKLSSVIGPWIDRGIEVQKTIDRALPALLEKLIGVNKSLEELGDSGWGPESEGEEWKRD